MKTFTLAARFSYFLAISSSFVPQDQSSLSQRVQVQQQKISKVVLHSSSLIGEFTVDLIIALFKATQVYQFQVNAILIVNFKPYFTNQYFTDNDSSANIVELHFLHNEPFILLLVSYTKIYVLNKKQKQNRTKTQTNKTYFFLSLIVEVSVLCFLEYLCNTSLFERKAFKAQDSNKPIKAYSNCSSLDLSCSMYS